MIRLFLPLFALLVLSLPARAQADVTGLWVTSFMGSQVECHLEQRDTFLWGVAFVTTPSGERNTYHLAGRVVGIEVTAMHGGGSSFVGALTEENKVEGLMSFANGAKLTMQARREKHGPTFPGGLVWPEGFPPAQ